MVVIENAANSDAPCWRLLNVRSGRIRDMVCAQGDSAMLYGKDVAFPLGWADEHTLYGLHWGTVTTTQAAIGPNVRPTGQWEIMLLDVRTRQIQRLPLPEMPLSYRRPLAALTARAYRARDGEIEFTALASNPSDQGCPTFVAAGRWDTGKKGWQGEPLTRCLAYPASDTFVIEGYRMWMVPGETMPLGHKILIERTGRIIQEITSRSSLYWGLGGGRTSLREDRTASGSKRGKRRPSRLKVWICFSCLGKPLSRFLCLPSPMLRMQKTHGWTLW